METGEIIRMMLFMLGVLLLMNVVLSLAKRKMKEHFCLVWGAISILFIVSGILLHPSGISQYLSVSGTIIIVILSMCAVWFLFYLSLQISVLNRKNQELAMQVSLLNQENEGLLEEIEKIKAKVNAE